MFGRNSCGTGPEKQMWLDEVNRFPEIVQLLSAQGFGHLIHRAQIFLSPRKDMHVSPDEAT